MWKQTALQRKEITGCFPVRDLSASASAFSHCLSTNLSLLTNKAHYHQTIFQLTACVHVLVYTRSFMLDVCFVCGVQKKGFCSLLQLRCDWQAQIRIIDYTLHYT